MRFESFIKKDRSWIEHWVAVHPDVRQELGDILAERFARFSQNVAGLTNRPSATGYTHNSAASLFASEMFFLSNHVLQRAIVRRLLDDNPIALRDAVFLSARLNYLSDLAKTPAYSRDDCLHVFEILQAYAVNDRQLTTAYLKRHPGPAKNGHPFTKLLCNSVTAILRNAPGVSAFSEPIKQRRESGYDKALLRAVAAVIDGDRELVTESLTEMLAGHRRKAIDDGMLRYFAVQAHGLLNLAADALRKLHNQPPPDPPEHPLWDEEFQALTAGELEPARLDTFAKFAPKLVDWARMLPTQVDHLEFTGLVEFRSATIGSTPAEP